MDTTISSSTPLDDPVAAVTKEWQAEEGNHDLADVDVRDLVLAPAVWRRGEDSPIRGGNSYVCSECEAVQAQCPKDVWEEQDLEGVLSNASAIVQAHGTRASSSYIL